MKVTDEVRECIKKMFNAFEKDKIRGYPEFSNNIHRISSILDIPRPTVYRMINQQKKSRSVKEIVQSIHGERVEKAKKLRDLNRQKLDDFDISLIRNLIHAMSKKGEFVSLRSLAVKLRQHDIILSHVTLRKYLNKNGFKFHKKHGKRFAKESIDVVAQRHRYLRQIKKFRDEGYEIVYTDETWLNANHTCPGEWSENRKGACAMLIPDCIHCSRHIPSGKGSRLIILDAGSSKTGFIPDVGLIFRSKTNSSDYHDEMNGKHFLEWFEHTLLPALPGPSVVVMDNAPYHNIKTKESFYPTKKHNKTEIVQWLTEKGIQADENEMKAELLEKVKLNKPEQVFQTDVLAMEYGHHAIRLPVKHCELNPIELIQGEEKMYVAKRNTTFKLKDVEQLFHEAKATITAESWRKAENHVIEKVEARFWEVDRITEEEDIGPFIINIHEDDDSDDSDDDDDDDQTDNENMDIQIDDHQIDNEMPRDVNNNVNLPGPSGDAGDDYIDDADDDGLCNKCGQREPPCGRKRKGVVNEEGEFPWICCDFCDRWLHIFCVKGNPDANAIYRCEECTNNITTTGFA